MLKLVIAEDEEIIRRGLVCTFDWEKLGVVVVGDAEDGVEALELIHEKKPDVVLTDIRMPRLSGIDLAKRLQGEHRTVHVVFLTSYADFDYAQQAVRLGAAFRGSTRPSSRSAVRAAVRPSSIYYDSHIVHDS